MSRKASLVWRVVIVAAACASENPKAFPGAVRDSAGIRVSECGASRDEPPLPWSIAETPDAVIGARGGLEHELSGVVGAVRLTDGHIVVANATPPELRVYDATGRFVRTIGREGPGPGEFRAIRSLQRFTGDSLVVFDSRLRRISLFGADGGAGRIIPVTGRPRDTMPGLAWVVGMLPDGTYLVYGERGMSDRAGIVNLPRRLARVWPSGDSAVELGIFSGDDWRFIPRPGGAVGFDNNPLFGRKTRFLIGRDAFHVAYNAHGEIRRYDLTGTLRAIHRLRRDPYRLTDGGGCRRARCGRERHADAMVPDRFLASVLMPGTPEHP